jgi:hypothetical protein
MDDMFGFGKATHRTSANVAFPFDGMGSFAGLGLLAGTQVATDMGWFEVETLRVGEQVLTFDNGLQTIVDIRRTRLMIDPAEMPQSMMPVLVPEGVMGNQVEMRLLPEQGVMVESDAVEDAYGDPFAVIPASTLVGFAGVTRDEQPCEIEVITLYFAKPQVVYADGGLLAYCPERHMDMAAMAGAHGQSYTLLTHEAAETVMRTPCFGDAYGGLKAA